jgi:hypothetical protein
MDWGHVDFFLWQLFLTPLLGLDDMSYLVFPLIGYKMCISLDADWPSARAPSQWW